MPYKLNEQNADCLAVPQIVVSRLSELEDDWLRVALYVLAHNECDENLIARELHLKSPKRAHEALLYWKGAGLLCDSTAEPIIRLDMPKAKLTTREIGTAALGDKNIASLVQECQVIMGAVITENDTNAIVELYLSDAMPVDMILMGVAHFVSLGKRSGVYIARALRTWQANGICTADDMERQLKLMETREASEKRAAELFGIKNAKFTRLESTKINEWYEGFGYDDAMIAEAIGYAGSDENKNVRYVNGILRRWYTSGYKTVQDVQASSAMNMQNVQSTGKAPTKDILQNALGKVPVYKSKREH